LIKEQAAAQQARRDARAQVIDILVRLYRLPHEEKRVTLLYIPKRNRTYWNLLGTTNPPWVTSFVGPALSGLAQLEGLPERKDFNPDVGYGFRLYNPSDEARRSSAPNQAQADLCRKAEGMGFRHIVVLDANRDGAPLLREWCFGGAQPIFN
jgi:hypothetical protein